MTRKARGGVLIVGSLNMDLVVGVDVHPRPGDTVLGSDLTTHPGGKGANQAAAAARVGGRVRMLGRLGRDAYGDALERALTDVGVDTSRLERLDAPTGVALITVDPKGENMIVVSPGANRRLRPDSLDAGAFRDAAVLLTQLEVPLETVERAVELAREAGGRVILNAAPGRELPASLLNRLDVLVVNEGEAALLAGLPHPSAAEGAAGDLDAFAARAAAALLRLGPGAVVVTLGAAGALWTSQDGRTDRIDAHPVEVVDTTAAGDAFCGALAARLAEGALLADAVRFANAAGALTTTRKGAQPSLPDREAVLALADA